MSDERDELGKFTKNNPYKWSPGKSGNPNGRPRGAITGSSTLRRMARQMIDPKTGRTALELIAAKLISSAMDGDLRAIQLFYERCEGKPGIRIEQNEITDWRELAELHGLTEEDVIAETRKLIESSSDSGSKAADKTA